MRSGGPVAEDRVGAAGEDRRHPPSLHREPPMANGEDAAVDTVQPPGGDAFGDGLATEPERDELPERNDAVLLGG